MILKFTLASDIGFEQLTVNNCQKPGFFLIISFQGSTLECFLKRLALPRVWLEAEPQVLDSQPETPSLPHSLSRSKVLPWNAFSRGSASCLARGRASSVGFPARDWEPVNNKSTWILLYYLPFVLQILNYLDKP